MKLGIRVSTKSWAKLILVLSNVKNGSSIDYKMQIQLKYTNFILIFYNLTK